MKMVFVFDEDKLRNEGYTQEACLKPIRKHFAEIIEQSKTIDSIDDYDYDI